MRFRDIVRFSFKALMSRKRRAALTLLGIFLGVTTLTAVIAFATGYGLAMQDIFKWSSMRTILVTAREKGFTDQDMERVRGIDGVERVMPLIRIPMEVNLFGDTNTYVVLGLDMEYVDEIFPDISLLNGDWPMNPEDEAVVIGSKVVPDVSPEQLEEVLGLRVTMSLGELRTKPRIEGIIAPYGTTILADVDRSILAPLDYAIDLYVDLTGEREYGVLAVIVEEIGVVEEVVSELSDEFGETAFIIAMKDIQRQLETVTQTSLIILGSIASMTIVVASIGIMNAMYTAVTERTRIIGVMRAMGATSRDVALMFLLEGVIMSSVAIISGMTLGYFASHILLLMMGGASTGGPHGTSMRFEVRPTLLPEHALAIAVVTLLITILGAIPPSLRAAKLEPAKALRFE